MIREVPAAGIETYAEHFPGPQAAMVIASVAEGNTAAQFWAPGRPEEQGPLLLWDKGNNVFYLSGRIASDRDRGELAHLIGTHIRQRALAERLAYFRVRPLAPSLAGWLPGLFAPTPLQETCKRFYRFSKEQPDEAHPPAVAGIHLALIDRGFLGREDLANTEKVRSEIRWMWPSLERFEERGFGVAALLGERVICWCTAEYMSRDQCGIGIETEEGYRSQGVATAATARFAVHCLERGITPHWECDGDNVGSVRVAEKVGFQPVAESQFWFGSFLQP